MKKKAMYRWMSVILISVLLLLTACGKTEENKEEKKETSSEERTFTAALGVMPANFDPTNLVGAGDMNATRNCYEPLVEEVRGTTDLEPWLAESYEIPDARTYVFKIRDGVKFADGTDLNADAVVYSYERAMAFVSSISTLVEEIESVEKTDEMTVTIKLKNDNSGFLYNVAKIGIISPSWCRENEKDGDWAQEYCARHTCGTGPYQVSEFEEDQYYTMTKYGDYWKGWKENQIDVIQTLIVKDNATQIQMLNSGEVDKLQIPITENLDILEANENIDVLTQGSLQTNIFTFNTQKAPFTDPLVREAVTLAMDYEGVKNNVYNGKATIPTGFMPALFAEHNGEIKEQAQDLEKAKELMKQSGIGECSITVHLCEGSDDQVQMAQILQSNLAEIGITLEIKVMPWLSMVEENSSPETAPEMSALNMGAFTGDGVFFLKQNFHSMYSGQPYNWSFYENPEFDRVIDEAAATVDEEEKQELLNQAQQILADDCAALYIVSPDSVEAINNHYKGFKIHPLDYYYSIRFYQLTAGE
ncbi:MAG: ABC transporter substrate-binding protein [Lachnospiraceae bacterium]